MNAIPHDASAMRADAEQSVKTRAAALGDLGQVMALLIWMGRENAAFSQNVEKATGCIADSIARGLTIVVEKDGAVIGCCALTKGAVWYSDDECLSDFAFYLHPEHRTFSAAKALVAHCKALADQLGVPLSLGVHSVADAERKLALFGRMMKLVGGFFIYMPERK